VGGADGLKGQYQNKLLLRACMIQLRKMLKKLCKYYILGPKREFCAALYIGQFADFAFPLFK
jgi:hypothetical protein